MDNLKKMLHTNKRISHMLMVLTTVVVFLVLKELAYIFIPLSFALIFSLVFMPLMRWGVKHNFPKWVSIILVVVIMYVILRVLFLILHLGSTEILEVDEVFWRQSFERLIQILTPLLDILGFKHFTSESYINELLNSKTFANNIYANIVEGIQITQRTITMGLLLLFFMILFLTGSMNVRLLMRTAIFNHQTPANRTMLILENSLGKFFIMKIVISIAVGVGVGLTCMFFGIRFPIFWALLAIILNPIQIVGGIATTLFLLLFALSQMDSTTSVITFISIISAIHIALGFVLEPIIMGKALKLNTITVLFMLMFWWYIWGIPGLILAIPITVMVKIVLLQKKETKIISQLMS